MFRHGLDWVVGFRVICSGPEPFKPLPRSPMRKSKSALVANVDQSSHAQLREGCKRRTWPLQVILDGNLQEPRTKIAGKGGGGLMGSSLNGGTL